ncbi:hypothetical protein CR513_08369, partial [Mucuna pruriens]
MEGRQWCTSDGQSLSASAILSDHLQQLPTSQILVLYLLDRERHLTEASCTTMLAWNVCSADERFKPLKLAWVRMLLPSTGPRCSFRAEMLLLGLQNKSNLLLTWYVKVLLMGDASFTMDGGPIPWYWHLPNRVKGLNQEKLDVEDQVSWDILNQLPRGMNCKEVVAVEVGLHAIRAASSRRVVGKTGGGEASRNNDELTKANQQQNEDLLKIRGELMRAQTDLFTS